MCHKLRQQRIYSCFLSLFNLTKNLTAQLHHQNPAAMPLFLSQNIIFKGVTKMLDIKFLRDNPGCSTSRISKTKFQDYKLPLVDEVIALDAENRATMTGSRHSPLQPQQGSPSRLAVSWHKGEKDEAEKVKAQVNEQVRKT